VRTLNSAAEESEQVKSKRELVEILLGQNIVVRLNVVHAGQVLVVREPKPAPYVSVSRNVYDLHAYMSPKRRAAALARLSERKAS
jgi:uracil DNA glycosylase